MELNHKWVNGEILIKDIKKCYSAIKKKEIFPFETS